MTIKRYIHDEYLYQNPTWHVEDSPWKAKQIFRMIRQNNIFPKTICEIGCGAGEILKQLQKNMNEDCVFWGYDISPHAYELCMTRSNERLHFECKDILQQDNLFFDLILLIDLIEHLEDYYSFLRKVKMKSKFTILHIPLDLSIQMVLRNNPLIKVRKSVGHIHYFTKDIALSILEDIGFVILDYFYTAPSIEQPTKSLKIKLAKLPRKLFFSINKDFAVRTTGGFALMVLAK